MRYPSSLLERLLGACVTLLLAALALRIAVHLLEDVWPALVGIAAVVVAVIGLVTILRRRQQGW